MNKKVRYAINGGLIGGATLGIVNAINQLSTLQNSNQKFNWEAFFKSIFNGAGIGAVAGLSIGAVADYYNSQEVPIDTDNVLFSMLNEIRLDKSNKDYQTLRMKSDWLMERLQAEFSGLLNSTPYRFGSTEKGTALAEGFDIDICLPIKPTAFSSIPDMFRSIHETLKRYIGVNGIIKVRDQKKSIGIIFLINGIEQKIDVLPHKITLGSKTSGFLFVNKKGLFEKSSRTKTDISLLNSLTLSETQKKLLVALKSWRNKRDIPISSHLLQYLVIESYIENRGYIPRKFTDKILMVLEFIRDNIEILSLRSIENTNNVLTNISSDDKATIIKACRKVIEDYEYQPNSIVNLIK